MRLTETTPLLRVRLREHPGHPDQKVHGRKGAAPVDSPEDYRGQHTAPGPHYGEPMHSLGSGDLIPADIRDRSTQMQHYGTGMPTSDRESFAALNKALDGGPNTPITVYRAAPAGVTAINSGDWVTPSRTYAEIHAAGNLPAGVEATIIVRTVKAKTLWWNGDSINEWGYAGPRLSETRLLEHPGRNHDQKSHAGKGGRVTGRIAEKRAAHVRGLRQLVTFHAKEAQRLGATYGWTGKSVDTVRAEMSSILGGGEPLRGFDDYTKWLAHNELAAGLGSQMAALGAST